MAMKLFKRGQTVLLMLPDGGMRMYADAVRVARVMKDYPGFMVGSHNSARLHLPPEKLLRPGNSYFLHAPSPLAADALHVDGEAGFDAFHGDGDDESSADQQSPTMGAIGKPWMAAQESRRFSVAHRPSQRLGHPRRPAPIPRRATASTCAATAAESDAVSQPKICRTCPCHRHRRRPHRRRWVRRDLRHRAGYAAKRVGAEPRSIPGVSRAGRCAVLPAGAPGSARLSAPAACACACASAGSSCEHGFAIAIVIAVANAAPVAVGRLLALRGRRGSAAALPVAGRERVYRAGRRLVIRLLRAGRSLLTPASRSAHPGP
ncbi:hypothetical protein CLOM_g3767 [Closterium sp. NIES-68]|nr:hypothetical protein CLOM_g3767 [Closterium sp. NIES-68]